MPDQQANEQLTRAMKRSRSAGAALQAIAALAISGSLTGCVVVGASSRGGLFIWPGGLGLLLVIALLVFILRRR